MPRKQQPISDAIQAKLEDARVTRLASLDAELGPHSVPVCFVYDGKVFYTAVDRKPKRVVPERLARLRHISAVPQVALLIDEYREDWRRRWCIWVPGKANLNPNATQKARSDALRPLRAKHQAYT